MKKKLLLGAMALTLLFASYGQSVALPTPASTDTPVVPPAEASASEPAARMPSTIGVEALPPLKVATSTSEAKSPGQSLSGVIQVWAKAIDGWGWPGNMEWDGGGIRCRAVITDGGTYKMWYVGKDRYDVGRIGYATSPDGLNWTQSISNPVLDVGAQGEWDAAGLESPFVIQAGPSSYKMWYSGRDADGIWRIGYATSSDGINWLKHPSNPVLDAGQDNWNNVHVHGPSILYEDSLYKMWLHTVGDDGGGPTPYVAYASSTNGITWTLSITNPLFSRDPAHDWESDWVWGPSVLHTGGDYQMWYSGAGGGETHTGYAMSPDETTWTKYDGGSDPVLSGTGGEWDQGNAVDPYVLYEGGLYTTYYDNNSTSIGVATSTNGITWTKSISNPVLSSPPGTALTVTLSSPDGVQKEVISITTTGSGQIPWTDLTSEIEEGDLITIQLGDEQVQFPILFVEAIADPETNVIAGVALPSAMVRASVEHPSPGGTGYGLETTADAAGNFSLDFSSSVDWEYGDNFSIGQFVHANGLINVTNNSPQVQIVQPPIETDRYVVTTFSSPRWFNPTQTANVLMDFDSDGDLDFIVFQWNWPPPQVPAPALAFRNDGAGNFTEATAEVFGGPTVETTNAAYSVVADFDGDGRDDLLIGEGGEDYDPWPGGQSLILIQNDSGQLINETATRLPQMLAFTHYLAAGDIDGDGDVDIYMSNIDQAGPRFYINDGSGFFTDDTTRLPASLNNSPTAYTASLLLDVDQDGDLDLVLGAAGWAFVLFDALLLNDGAGFFDFAPDTSLPPRLGGLDAGTVAMSTADFDNDGWPDLLMSTHANYSDPTNMFLQLLLNNGDGTFRDETSRIDQDWPAYEPPGCDGGWGSYWLVRPFSIDSNNDAWPDILVGGASCVMHLLFESVGGERFEVVENLSEIERHTSDYPWAIVPGDVDGDGDEDIILLYFGSAHHQVLLRKNEAPYEVYLPVVEK